MSQSAHKPNLLIFGATGGIGSALARTERRRRLRELCFANAEALLASLRYCAAHGLGAFRVNSQILPVKTHPEVVYEVQQHLYLADGLSVEDVTERATATWRGREPLFHLSSPLAGWDPLKPERHHDYIDPSDFPAEWKRQALTVEVESKAKELAVLKLLAHLRADG